MTARTYASVAAMLPGAPRSTQDPEEHGAEPDHHHADGRRDRRLREHRPDRDERGADADEPEIRRETAGERSAEVGEDERGERPERGEQRHRVVADDLDRERVEPGRDQRGADRLAQIDLSGIV